MPTISVKIIKKPRVMRFCGDYRHNVLIPGNDPHIRIYGSACEGDPPYALYICLECASKSNDPKIIKAIAAHNQRIEQASC